MKAFLRMKTMASRREACVRSVEAPVTRAP
jgi:hypothetical protein